MKTLLFSIATVYLLSSPMLQAQNTTPYWSLAGNSNVTPSSKLGTTNDISLRFYTKNVLRMIINSAAGNVGIGTTSPQTKLHISDQTPVTTFPGIKKAGLRIQGSSAINNYALLGFSGVAFNGVVYPHNLAQIGAKFTNDGSSLSFGTSNNYATGITNTAMTIDPHGNITMGGPVGAVDGRLAVMGAGYEAGIVAEGSQYGVVGIGLGVPNSGIYGITINSAGYAGYFSGSVYSTGSYQTSDRTLKQDISNMTRAMDIIKKLQPKSYTFRQEGNYKLMNLPTGKHYGLIAQDVEQVLPNLVKATTFEPEMVAKLMNRKPESASSESIINPSSEMIEFKALNYTELIPIMIKAMQEQEAKIEALTQLVNKLSVKPSAKLTGATLGQSTPNPNSTTTWITCNIPAGFSKAELVINNEAGQKVKQIQLTKSGLIDIDTSRLSAGIYFYTLFVNGTFVDTKKMVVTR